MEPAAEAVTAESAAAARERRAGPEQRQRQRDCRRPADVWRMTAQDFPSANRERNVIPALR
ncbi:MAG: hypothetical protein ACLQVA_02010 [Candidatus Brocadiia bacterium]